MPVTFCNSGRVGVFCIDAQLYMRSCARVGVSAVIFLVVPGLSGSTILAVTSMVDASSNSFNSLNFAAYSI